MSHNYVREWREFEHLTELPCLEDLVFIGNPLEEEATANGKYNDEITKRLLYLKKLDGFPVIRNVEVAEEEEVNEVLEMEEIDRMANEGDDDEDEDENEDDEDEDEDDDEDGNDEDVDDLESNQSSGHED